MKMSLAYKPFVPAGLRPQDVFDIQLGTASALDGLSTTGWDMLIGKSRVNATDWSWRNSVSGLSTTLAPNSTAAAAAFSSYSTLMGAGNGVVTRLKRAPKFLDVVTYTGDGASNRMLGHTLGVVPGLIIFKAVSATGPWHTIARAGSGNYVLGNQDVSSFSLDSSNSAAGSCTLAQLGASSTQFDVAKTRFNGSTWNSATNASGVTYVAYLFAHDPDPSGIVQCGSFTTDGSGAATVNLGWRPQYLLMKASSSPSNWFAFDASRGWASGSDNFLQPNSSAAEASNDLSNPTSAGFTVGNGIGPSTTGVYLAIREPI